MMWLQFFEKLSDRRRSAIQVRLIRMQLSPSGVSPGRATKVCELLTDHDKTYEALL